MPQFRKVEIEGFRIFIYGAPNEENPPHFHLVKNGETICRFKIKNFKPLDNCKLRGKKLKEIKKYWRKHKKAMLAYFCKLNPKLCESRD